MFNFLIEWKQNQNHANKGFSLNMINLNLQRTHPITMGFTNILLKLKILKRD